MHECPYCGQACYCDMEDHYNSMAGEACVHECDDLEFDDEDRDEDDERPWTTPEAPSHG